MISCIVLQKTIAVAVPEVPLALPELPRQGLRPENPKNPRCWSGFIGFCGFFGGLSMGWDHRGWPGYLSAVHLFFVCGAFCFASDALFFACEVAPPQDFPREWADR